MNAIEKMEAQMNSAVLSGVIGNIKNFIPEQHRPEFEKGMQDFLPKIKEFLKEKLDVLNKKCGETPETKKMFLLHNLTGVPEIWVFPKSAIEATEQPIIEYSLEKLIQKIDAYEKTETLIIDLITLKLFDLDVKK